MKVRKNKVYMDIQKSEICSRARLFEFAVFLLFRRPS